MKHLRILLVCFLYLCFLRSYGVMCDWGMTYYPNTEALQYNSFIIVTAYGNFIQQARQFNEKYPVYLKSEKGQKILLVIHERLLLNGAIQFVLKPEKKLKIGLEYEFCIDRLETHYNWHKKNMEYPMRVGILKREGKVIWKAVDYQGIGDFSIEGQSQILEKRFEPYSGSVKVQFAIKCDTNAVTLVKVSLKGQQTQKIQVAYVELKKHNTIIMSFSGCGSNFEFSEDYYYASFEFIESSGKIYKMPEIIEFVSPKAEYHQKQKEKYKKLLTPEDYKMIFGDK